MTGKKAVVKASAQEETKPKSRQGIRHTATFWGVRGTLPTPGVKTLRYGGNTACVEVRFESQESAFSLVIDAGSGIADFGDHALRRGDREFHIFLSHVHYDHIIGLTRFAPLFRKDCRVTFYGNGNCDKSLYEILYRFFSYPYFPVEFDALGVNPNLSFCTIQEEQPLKLGPAFIRFQRLNHPQGAIGFRVENIAEQTSLVYMTDHEHGLPVDEELSRFASGATLLIYDSTYNQENYGRFKGYGHSTPQQGARIANTAKVGVYALFHHEPSMSDKDLERVQLPEARQVFPLSFLSYEGLTVDLELIKKDPKAFLVGLEKRSTDQNSRTPR